MYLGISDIYKIGIGPSSSHTFWPMVAALRFVNEIRKLGILFYVRKIKIELYGSLGMTGRGHLSDYAIILGLSGYTPKMCLLTE